MKTTTIRYPKLLAGLTVATLTLLASSPAQAYKSWNTWYPLDRGQASGQRAVNPWNDPDFPGQSVCKYSSTPAGLPATFAGSAVQYFLNWWDVTPKPVDYAEVMSIRGPGGSHLDLWAHGKPWYWRVFYNPSATGACTVESIEAMNDRHQAGPKLPLTWKLPNNPGQTYTTNLACMAVFGNKAHPYDYNVVRAASYEWVEIKNVEDNGHTVHATNYYYTSDHNRCLPGYEDMDKTLNEDGIIVDGCVRLVENYHMQKQLLTPLTGGMFEVSLETKGNLLEAEDSDGLLFSMQPGSC